MIKKVRTYINKYKLLTEDKSVIIGLSGGADSVALLSILIRLGYQCIALHCNFHLRGEESDRDEVFSENLAQNLSIPFYKTNFDTFQYAKEKCISIEMAARELRYIWFEEMRHKLNAQAIAVAHHKDDNAETLLLNLIRGTGIRGLRGMRPRNGYIIRPLLSVTREEILTWLKDQQLTYVTDSTNLSDEYTRNFIRLRILPLFEELNPSVKESLARTSDHMAEAEIIYQSVIEKAKITVFKENKISISKLMTFPSPETILYELLIPYNFTRLVTEQIFGALDKESGKTFYSPTHRLIKDRTSLLITRHKKPDAELYILNTEEGKWDEPIELSWHTTVIDKEFHIKRDKNIAYFDYDSLTFPLTLRTWHSGDWFIPFGMKGRKKISDYFSDNKFSLLKKEKTWLLCNGDDIIWIVGERTDNRYRVKESSSRALIVNFSSKKESNK